MKTITSIGFIGLSLAFAAACGGGSPSPEGRESLAANSYNVSHSGLAVTKGGTTGWSQGPAGAVVNFQDPTDDQLGKFDFVSDHCVVGKDVQFVSVEPLGGAGFELITDRQSGSIVYNQDTQAFEPFGIAGGALFGAGGFLQINTPLGEPLAQVDAPPASSPDTFIGPRPAGTTGVTGDMQRLLRAPAGVSGIIAVGFGASGNFATCRWTADVLATDGDVVTHPMFDQATIDALAAKGITVTGFSIGYYNAVDADLLGGSAPLEAAELFFVSAADFDREASSKL